MKKVLFVESGTTGGGSFESLFLYLKAVDRGRIDPVVVFLNQSPFIRRIEQLGIQVYLVQDLLYSNVYPAILRKILGKASFFVSSYIDLLTIPFLRIVHAFLVRELIHVSRSEKVDLIYLNDQINRDMFGVFVAKRLSIPCVSHLRSMDGQYFSRHKARLANSVVSAYVSNSYATKDFWEKKGTDKKVEHHVVHNAVSDPHGKRINLRTRHYADAQVKFLIGSVGRLIPLKGFKFLLRSFHALLQVHLESRLIIIGEGPQKNELIDYAKDLGITQQVIFTGFIENAQAAIEDLDLFVLPSRYEAFGRVILEAMQRKVPVIGTDLYGITELIEHEKNGLLVPYNDDKALTQAMQRLLTDNLLREKLTKEALHSITQKFSMETYKFHIDQIILNLLTKKHQTR